jgi:hypothetical protein
MTPMETTNFILKFGKYKGQNFQSTPQSYQSWLMSQDWFKAPTSNEARYDVVRKFVSEYARGMGIRFERVVLNLTWDEAVQYKDNMNLCQLDDCTEYYYIESSKNNC